MKVGRPPTQSYGPSLLDTVERGDIFYNYRHPGKRFEVEGKIYNDDLSVTYLLNSGRRRLHKVDEDILLKRGSGSSRMRSHKTIRNLMTVVLNGTA